LSIDRRYWDSDCFLGFLQAEPDKEALCQAVLNEAERSNILIVTSALTIAEVLHLRGRVPLPKAVRRKVADFFKNEYISIRNVTRRVAEAARDLVWDHGIKPKDAIHVATALDARLALMNTFDEDLIRKSGQLGRPALLIGKPQPSAQSEFDFGAG
jgi:predicted nucleic acid-binding protein